MVGLRLLIAAAAVTETFCFVLPQVARTAGVSLKMSDDDKRAQIAFDQKSGRLVEAEIEDCDPQEEFCSTDERTGKAVALTIEEKERIFLDSLQSYYASGKQLLSDDDFDLLKEDLTWNGSPVVQMNRKEATYVAAMQAYLKGDPIISDQEFDTLKRDLRDAGSQFAVSKEPKCVIETGICTVTLMKDKFRSNLLYLPAGAVLSLIWLGLGYEFFNLVLPLNPLILILLGGYPVFTGAKYLTENFIFENNLIVYGPCPHCEAENRVYFGDILGVQGYGDAATIKCQSCRKPFTIQRKTLRATTAPK